MDVNFSSDFSRLSSTLVSIDGVTYREFRRNLVPHYSMAKMDVVLSYFYLILSGFVIMKISSFLNPIVTLVIGSVLFGFFIAHNQLYLHAAAHYNLDKNRKVNDVISNMFIGIFSGEEIAAYRKNHFLHHKLHGTIKDTENSYFYALNGTFLLKLITMVHALKIIKQRVGETQKSSDSMHQKSLRQKILAAIFHIVLFLVLCKINFILAVSWFAGLVVFFPLFGALRQILEHRDEFADPNKNYYQVDHGQINRIFKTTPFSYLFGGAGFLKHALHHLDPAIAYTNLSELEGYLKKTSLEDVIKQHTTTYTKTFLKLFR